MKNLILILSFCLISINLRAQGNLQFNQVKLVESTLETVPVGKVWKVESASYTSGPMFSISSGVVGLISFEVNNKSIYPLASGSTNTLNDTKSFPMWLPAGTTLKAGTNVSYLSVIEYNIIP